MTLPLFKQKLASSWLNDGKELLLGGINIFLSSVTFGCGIVPYAWILDRVKNGLI